jgi:phosphoglycerate kinase
MAYTFLRAKGVKVGRSLVEEEKIEVARQVLNDAETKKYRLMLPVDHVVAVKPEERVSTAVVPDDQMGLDIGPRTVEEYSKILGGAKTVVWNGPMGVFEVAPFAKGTLAMAEALTRVKGTTIVGGGDSVAAISQAGVEKKISHVCTGGGASLEFLAGKTLPGVAALPDK